MYDRGYNAYIFGRHLGEGSIDNRSNSVLISFTEFDSFEECAVTVHKKCVRYYATLLAKDHQICKDAGKLNACYDLYSKSINCKAKIIQHFVSVVENVAQRVLHLIKDMKSLCTRSEEL